jgi:hypothetical protein
MTTANPNRRALGTLLLLAGLLLLVVGGIYMVRSQAQGAALRDELRAGAPAPAASATPAQVAAARASNTPASRAAPATATRVPTATRVAPTATSTVSPATAAPTATGAATATSAAGTAVAAAPPTTRQSPMRMVMADLKIETTVVPMGWRVIQTQNGPASEWVIPQDEAGHHINSAALGEPGNLVISGHNNIYAQVFKPISLAWDNDTRVKVDDFTDRSDLLNGRVIELYDETGARFEYVVREFYRLKDTGVSYAQRIANGRYILPTEDTRLTVVTCWPPTNNTHRLILIAEPVQ